jgi:uncharacterized protein YrrD
MLVELSRLKGMPVGALEEGVLLGNIEKVIINPDDIRLIGLLVKPRGFFKEPKAVSFLDVVDVDSSAVVIRSAEGLVAADEIVRLGNLLKYKFEFIGLPVRNKQKKNIGRVTDAVVETASGDVLRIYVHSLMSDRVFERSFVEKVTLKEVIVRDSEGRRVKSGARAEAAAPKIAEMI